MTDKIPDAVVEAAVRALRFAVAKTDPFAYWPPIDDPFSPEEIGIASAALTAAHWPEMYEALREAKKHFDCAEEAMNMAFAGFQLREANFALAKALQLIDGKEGRE